MILYVRGYNKVHRIQWIITKSKSGMVTRGITHLALDTFPVIVMESNFYTTSWQGQVSIYINKPLWRYITRLHNKNFSFTTSSGNISIAGYGASSLVNTPHVNFVSANQLGKTSVKMSDKKYILELLLSVTNIELFVQQVSAAFRQLQ